MKVYRLIRELQKCNPDAEVRMHDNNGNPVLFVIRVLNDDTCVRLEDKDDCDFEYQLKCRYDMKLENDEGDLEFYTDLVEHGVTIDDVNTYMGEDYAENMRKVCEKYGLGEYQKVSTNSEIS